MSASKAQTPCYCLGARHRVVTNCMECGYLLCEKDSSPDFKEKLPSMGADSATVSSSSSNTSLFCPSCRAPCVLPYSAKEIRDTYGTETPEAARYVRAYELKDRLLQFDQEHAQRTKVFDAQRDYYNSGANLSWLNDKERQRLEAIEAWRQNLSQRSRLARKVNIVFNIAGQRVVDVDPLDDDMEMPEEFAEEEFSSPSEKAEAANEARRLAVCKEILDERDQGSGDALLPTATANGSWTKGSLKDQFSNQSEN